MTGLYDVEASRRRVESAERTLRARQIYVASQTEPEARSRGEASLEDLHDLVSIAKKTHVLIMEIASRRQGEAARR